MGSSKKLATGDGGTGVSEAELWRIFWAKDDPLHIYPPASDDAQSKCAPGAATRATTTGIGTAIGIGILSFLAPEFSWIPVVAGAVAGGGAAVGSLSGDGCL